MEALKASILQRAQKTGLIEIFTHNLRQWGLGKHQSVDDTPYGGGAGMLLRVDVLDQAIQAVKAAQPEQNVHTVLLTPQGEPFSQKLAQALSEKPQVTLICGHYEGFDERIRSLVDQEISIGPYVLTGGEFPALVVIDAVSRLVEGVITAESPEEESFSLTDELGNLLLEYPQYTKPADYNGQMVPEILLSGHHGEIKKWRLEQAKLKTNIQ